MQFHNSLFALQDAFSDIFHNVATQACKASFELCTCLFMYSTDLRPLFDAPVPCCRPRSICSLCLSFKHDGYHSQLSDILHIVVMKCQNTGYKERCSKNDPVMTDSEASGDRFIMTAHDAFFMGTRLAVVECKNLRDKERFGQNDPYCVVSLVGSQQSFQTTTKKDAGSQCMWEEQVL